MTVLLLLLLFLDLTPIDMVLMVRVSFSKALLSTIALSVCGGFVFLGGEYYCVICFF